MRTLPCKASLELAPDEPVAAAVKPTCTASASNTDLAMTDNTQRFITHLLLVSAAVPTGLRQVSLRCPLPSAFMT